MIENRKSKAAKLQRHMLVGFGRAVREYRMISRGDHVMVCLSGGKDSLALLDLLMAYQRKAQEKFHISAVHIDHRFPGFPVEKIAKHCQEIGVSYHLKSQDIYGTMKEKIPQGKSMCSLCARLRRGAIYSVAQEIGAGVIALGHHMEDIVETLFLNMFHGAKMKGMPPVYLSGREKFRMIRPMAYLSEKDLIKYADTRALPVIEGNFCGAPENLQRKSVKKMMDSWRRDYPGRIEKIFSSLQNVETDTLAVLPGGGGMNKIDLPRAKI